MPEMNRTIQTANFSSDYVSVKDFGAVGDGVTDDTAAIQAAIDSLSDYQTLVAEGTFRQVGALQLRKSNVVYDFRGAKFIQEEGGISLGNGLLIGDNDNRATVHKNITILGGEYYPEGDATDAYPIADFNPIAVAIGTDITIVSPRIYPTYSTRAISLQTNDFWGSAPYENIKRVKVIDAKIIGDGNAPDGVDIGTSGYTNMIEDVSVEATVEGCKRGVHVYTGANAYTLNNINLDVNIDGTDEIAGTISRINNSDIKINAKNIANEGFDCYQLDNASLDFQIHGIGSGLGTALLVRDTGVGSKNLEVNAKIIAESPNLWTIGFQPQIMDAQYPAIYIDGAATGISTGGWRSNWGSVSFKNCTTPIDSKDRDQDVWNNAVDFGTGANPQIVANSSNRFTSNVGDAGKTLVVGADDPVQRWGTALTADRTCDLTSAGGYQGAEFHLIRADAGGFNLNVTIDGGGTVKAMPATSWSTWVHTGSSWVIKGYGSL